MITILNALSGRVRALRALDCSDEQKYSSHFIVCSTLIPYQHNGDALTPS
jgi:hypothetical protein